MTRWTEADVRHLMARAVGPGGKVSRTATPVRVSVTKHGNKPTTVDNIRFASAFEAKRYGELKLMQSAGEIAELEPHPKFSLDVNGYHIGNYTGDFGYRVPGGYVCEDCKYSGTRTEAYGLRKKLMKAIHGIDVTEVS